ncbi:MAG: Holliday junction resolvase RuvX [Acidobacteria bacterium]|nr:Holliday junction resolvase RuvX [Acidobacteriota bacterium]
MRILAIDYGRKRIGLAMSDPLGMMAHSLETLVRASPRKDVAHIARLIGEHEVSLLVAGNPILLNGEASEMSVEAEAFAARVAKRARIPYKMWDERMSSVEAGHWMRDAGLQPKRDGSVDRMAARILLDSYLAAQ